MTQPGDASNANPVKSVGHWFKLLVGVVLLALAWIATQLSDAQLISEAANLNEDTQMSVSIALTVLAAALGALGVGVMLVAAVALGVAQGSAKDTSDTQSMEKVEKLLESINQRLLISESAKRIAYREKERQALQRAIQEDIEKGDFDAALVLSDELAQSYGYRELAEEYRERITGAQTNALDDRIRQAKQNLEKIVAMGDFNQAMREADKLMRLYPESPQVRGLDKQVLDAQERHKKAMERRFLDAAQRDDVETAMELLKELDKHLTEAEAEPFRETARGVITKKKQNLGVQFKLAVHDREWTHALQVGKQIMIEFPNTKMSDEVRGMLDLLRERAAGEDAARTREYPTSDGQSATASAASSASSQSDDTPAV